MGLIKKNGKSYTGKVKDNEIPNYEILTDGIRYRKYGHFVEIIIDILKNVTNTGVALGTLPEGYRPSVTVIVANAGTIQGGQALPVISIAPNGIISVVAYAPLQTYVRAHIMFLV